MPSASATIWDNDAPELNNYAGGEPISEEMSVQGKLVFMKWLPMFRPLLPITVNLHPRKPKFYQ